MLIGNDAFNYKKPPIGKIYFFVQDGKIEHKIWGDDVNDILHWRTGNCFFSKDDAKFAFEKMLILRKLQQFADANNPEVCLRKNEEKFILCYRRNLDAIEVIPIIFEAYGTVVFNSREIAQQAIKEIGAETLKKFLFKGSETDEI